MASFFQSSLASPNVDPGSKFVYFRKPTISIHGLAQDRWHVLVLILGVSAVLAGSVLHILFRLWGRRDRIREVIYLPFRLFQIVPKSARRCCRREEVQQSLPTIPAQHSDEAKTGNVLSLFSNVRSFCITATSPCDSHECGMHIRSGCNEDFRTYLLSGQAKTHNKLGSMAPTPTQLSESASEVPVLGSLDLRCLIHDSQLTGGLRAVALLLNAWRLVRGYKAIVVRCDPHDNSASLDELLSQMRQIECLLVIRADADSHIWDDLNFDLISGILLDNACVLQTGERRDFFQAQRVRQCAARCKYQRSHRPGFFFGFIELWKTISSPAALRRAYKLAGFFEAKVLAMPSEDLVGERAPLKEMPLSGFDWLKKPDVIWLQRAWSKHTHFSFMEDAGSTPVQMDLACLRDALPAADRMLSAYPLDPSPAMIEVDSQSPYWTSPPVPITPSRADIWYFTSCGAELCAGGSFSLREEIVQSQYDAVLTIQRSLKHNRLLRMYSEAENLRVCDSLTVVLHRSSYPDLMTSLLNGLAEHRIRVFAGLDSGFTLPDGGGHLWAISEPARNQFGSPLDIHISLKVPNDVATIWHTFLAHSGVPRLQRYEEELLLTSQPNDKREEQLPLSIVRELEESSESELLYLVERIIFSRNEHPFDRAIVEAAEHYLVQDVTLRAWSAFNSRACLDGSVSVRTLLEQRIAYFTYQGAAMLPTLENLVSLHELLEQKLETALRTCDRATLDVLTNPLLVAYGHAGATHAVLPSVDLYGLMLFCALRRLAFEDVYLETTDRCPLFLVQPDQAGVFAELWVLGSQCEAYFGISPRSLGEIAYNRHQLFLSHNPPPQDAWNSKEVFTAYSVPPITDEVPVRMSKSHAMGIAGKVRINRTSRQDRLSQYRKGASTTGALSIFCFPAILDVMLLTFLGRGLYLTAFMNEEFKLMADYAIITALIMTGGITGFVGSTGGFYMFNVSTPN